MKKLSVGSSLLLLLRNDQSFSSARVIGLNAPPPPPTVVDEDYSVAVGDVVAISGNSAVLRYVREMSNELHGYDLDCCRCVVSPAHLRPYVRVTSWLHEEGAAIELFPETEPRGKYALQGGMLLVHHTSAYDSYKKYTCKAEHTLTGARRRSREAARLTLTGEERHVFSSNLFFRHQPRPIQVPLSP
jgi:hypothetical protein